MQTTNDFLDSVKEKHRLGSDYALAGCLGITRSMVSAYRTGKRMLGDGTAVRVAELLEVDPGYVLASIEAERTHNAAARKAWENLAELVKRHGVAAGLLLLAVIPSQIGGALLDAVVCILCKIRRAGVSSLAPARRYGWNAYAVPH